MPDYLTSERPQIIEQLRSESRGLTYRPAKRKKAPAALPDPANARNLFTVCTGNRWMELGERRPAAKMLFGEFWYEHEICFLFASANTGKSVLAVQIGDAIARGGKTGPFACQAAPAVVLYADFELSTLQFRQRYSGPKTDYDFPAHFFRAELNAGGEIPDEMDAAGDFGNDEWLIAGLEYRIRQLNATVLIVDNLSCLCGGIGNATGALRIMKQLQALRNQYNLSVLVLAHTPKRRNPSLPPAAEDMHGSKLLVNFADSAFTIGVSNNDGGLRYLKQIKQRSTAQVYGDGNVCLSRIQKRLNFLQFEFEGHSNEQPLLLSPAQAQRRRLAAQAKTLSATGLTQRQVSGQLNLSVGTVNKLLNLPGSPL